MSYVKKNIALQFRRPWVDACSDCKELSIRIEIPVSESAKWASSAKLLLKGGFQNTVLQDQRGVSVEQSREQEDARGLTRNVLLQQQEIFCLGRMRLFCFGMQSLKNGTWIADEVCSVLVMHTDSSLLLLFGVSICFQADVLAGTRITVCLAFTVSNLTSVASSSLSLILPSNKDFGTLKKKLEKNVNVGSLLGAQSLK
jgi:hypothetical protein